MGLTVIVQFVMKMTLCCPFRTKISPILYGFRCDGSVCYEKKNYVIPFRTKISPILYGFHCDGSVCYERKKKKKLLCYPFRTKIRPIV